MIKATITNEMLARIVSIENCRVLFPKHRIPPAISSRLRKNSKKKSTYASNAIEGNPLSEQQASDAVDSRKRHFLKPEEEVRNYYQALTYLDKELIKGTPFSKKLILDVQKIVVAGEPPEKIGFRGPMPPGVLFAVYDSTSGKPDYIPPEASEVESLIDSLCDYVATSDDHALVKAGIIHYELVTIHPFEDGNGRTARILSGYYLDLCGYGFGGVGSLEEYFAYDAQEYYAALQMGLPALYYNGRNNPPHPEVWLEYFLRMVELYAQKSTQLVQTAQGESLEASLSHLSKKERAFFDYLIEHDIREFTPIQMADVFDVSNRTIINWSAALAKQDLVEPVLVKQRIRSYKVR
ncbi:MAG: Fic family protein [Eggerthellaceae bacterium]|nr:Fic family protein [Eggerthellaceae bacterium]